MTGTPDGWLAAAGHIVGTVHEWETVYTWDGSTYLTRSAAISHGFQSFGSDDFNVGRVRGGRLVWWGWMEKEHPAEDRASAAVGLGLRPS